MVETRKKLAQVDPVWSRIREEGQKAVANEPLLGGLVHACVLHHDSLETALAYRIAQKLASAEMSEQLLREIADEAYRTDPSLGQKARADIMAVYERDPACHRFIQPLLYFKGFQAIQAYRVAHWLFKAGRLDLSYFIQMRVSEQFGIDIHPAAVVGQGIMIDHAHSIVLGNITVGNCSRIAAGSVVLDDVPPCKTVAGVPAKIVGEAGCDQPSVTMDQLLSGSAG